MGGIIMIESDVLIQLRETHHKLTQMMQIKLDEDGITPGLLYITILIDENPNASQKELAQAMRFTEGAMSCAVKRLLKLNILEQKALESDLRYNRLVVTEKGREIINRYRDYLFKRYKSIFSGFSNDELVKLRDLLLKINANIDKINAQIEKEEM